MATEYELTFFDYLSIMRRRAPYLIGIFVAVLLISAVFAIVMPPTYRATGTIMVESQKIPDNIVPSAIRNQLDEQINMINQRVMTRGNLLQIANKYNLFQESAGTLTTTELIDKMRSRIIVETDTSNNAMRTNRQGQRALAFTLSFEDRRPEVALQVTNELIKLFLDWNVKLRTEGATETTDFLTQESEKLKIEVDRLEKLISAYKQQNRNALPEQLTLRMTMLARAENDLREVERDVRSTKEELRSLEVELSAAKHGLGEESSSQSLPALQTELARLSSVYKESHPDIRRLKRKIESMERSADTPASGIASADITSLASYRIQAKIDSDKARLSSLAEQKEMLQRKISENESAMIQTPKVEQGLDILIRDRDSAQKKFEEIRNKQMNAQIAENLESESKSERFSVLEPPLLPEKPFKPDRIKIFALGFFLAIVSSGGAMMLLESIDKRVRGTEALTHVLGSRPLVVIPYLPVLEDGVRRKRMFRLAIISAIVAMIVTIVAIHYLYLPLDILFVKILAKLM
jgi:succinoglycan biosynthesis transport protein ExoP